MVKYISIIICIILVSIIYFQKKENNILVRNNTVLQESNKSFTESFAKIEENNKKADKALSVMNDKINTLQKKQDSINIDLKEMLKNEDCKAMYNTNLCAGYVELWNKGNSN